MTRIPYPEGATPRTIPLPGGGERPELNVERMLKHLPKDLHAKFVELGAAIIWHGTLPPLLREIAIVRAGALLPSAYELHHHVPLARSLGVTDEQIEALHRPDAAKAFKSQEAAVVEVVDDLMRGPKVSDAVLGRVRGYLSDAQLFELIVTVGYYMIIGRLLETTGVEPETFTLQISAAD